MKSTQSRFLILLVIIVMVLSACERSASESPTEESTAENGETNSQEALDLLGGFATQTAAALEGLSPEITATKVSEAATLVPTTESEVEQPEVEDTETPEEPETGLEPKTYKVPKTYTIHDGEFPYCLARRFNINPTALLNANGLGAGSLVYAGNVLTIPQNAAKYVGQRALLNHPRDYAVSANETIYSIARKFGDVFPMAIADTNNLTKPYKLTAGQTLSIP